MPAEGSVRNGVRPGLVAAGVVVALVAMLVVFALTRTPSGPVAEPDPPPTVPAPITSSTTSTGASRPVTIPIGGFATLGPDGIRGSHGLTIWAERWSDPGRIVRDHERGIVYSAAGAIWWLRPGSTAPALVAEIAGDPVEVLSNDGDPVVRVGQCPSVLIRLTDGSLVAEAIGFGPTDAFDGRVDIDCESGLIRWHSANGLSAWLEPPDADGRIWLMVLDFDLTVARVPVSNPHVPLVRIEDFDGISVLLSRAEKDRPDERTFLVLDLNSVTVNDYGLLAGSGGVLLGRDVSLRPEYWEPSQSIDDARRDGVLEELAALPLGLRSDTTGTGGRHLSRATPEGEWRASRPRSYQSLCGCHYEYGELLLVAEGWRVLKAVPMPGAPLVWIAVEGEHVYAGRIGDGALPDSVLVRVDRTTMDAMVVVFRHEHGALEWPDGWHLVDWGSPLWGDYEKAIGTGEPFDGGTRVEPWIWVDFSKVDRLIDAASN